MNFGRPTPCSIRRPRVATGGPAELCLLCDHPHGRPVPCLEPWAYPTHPRLITTVHVEGDRL